MVEAMACGLPPIVVNYGGPGEIVANDCGICLPMAPRKELVDQLATAMTGLLHNPEQCRSMAVAGLERVQRYFSWPQKAAQIVAIYRDLLGLAYDESSAHDTQRDGNPWPGESGEALIEGLRLPSAKSSLA